MNLVNRDRVIGVASTIVFFLSVFALILLFSDPPVPSPRAAFESHLLALDEGRLDDANALVDITCGRLAEIDADAARSGLEGAGYTFQTAFQVETVWMNDRGTEAILELASPVGLPLPRVQGMMKVDGEWLLSCGR